MRPADALPDDLPVCLLVDDSATDRAMVARVFRASGHPMRLVMAATLGRAQAILSGTAVRAIILDNRLPDGAGIDFATWLSRQPRFRSVPVLLITDMPSPFMWEKARLAGVRAVVDKSSFGPAVLETLGMHRVSGAPGKGTGELARDRTRRIV